MALPGSFDVALERGLGVLGLEVDAQARAKLASFTEQLLRWNARVNLTAISDPAQVAELHLVDSLALLRSLGDATTLLDVGSGAGIPGAVLACARPGLRVTCCDSVAKKVSFVKAVAAQLDLPVVARAVRAGGAPEQEGLGRHDAVVSRALADPARWLPLGKLYVAPGGRLLAMLGREGLTFDLAKPGRDAGVELERVDRFQLPCSGAERGVATYRVT